VAICQAVAAVAAVAGIVSPLPSGLSHGTPGIAAARRILQTSRGPHRRRRRLMVMIGNGHTQLRPSAGIYTI